MRPREGSLTHSRGIPKPAAASPTSSFDYHSVRRGKLGSDSSQCSLVCSLVARLVGS